MDARENSNVKLTWELISQFVCWDFCRNANFEGHVADVRNQTDLLHFFRERVIKMTSKQHERDITPHEIAAKFFEELSLMARSSDPGSRSSSVVKLSDSLKRKCPELRPAIADLVSSIFSKMFLLEEMGLSALIEDEEVRESMKMFALEVCKYLPVPELIKGVNSGKKSTAEQEKVSVTKEAVISRLKKEKLTRSEMMKIKGYLEEDSLLKMYFDEVSYTGPGLEDFPEDETETNTRPETSSKSSRKKTTAKNSKSSARNTLSLDDYFIHETHEVDETPVRGSRNKSRAAVYSDTSDSDVSDEPEIITEKLSEQTKTNLRLRLERVDPKIAAAGKRANTDEMLIPVDQIKKEIPASPQKTGQKSGKTKKKR